MLGISIYPDKTSVQQNIDYIKMAHKYGFKRIFSCLLSVDEPKEEIKNKYNKIISFATSLGMEVILDIAPSVFSKLNISYDDLSFFKELGATGIRLDEGFGGQKESQMTYNDHDLDIEINMSIGTKYVNTIMSYQPNEKKLFGCHNFYPMEFSGLSLEHFLETSKQYKELNLRSAAFVTSQSAKIGPWPVMDGLCTLEMHRRLPIVTQIKHHLLMNAVDDIIIGNCYASEEEFIAISKIGKEVNLDIEFSKKTSQLEKEITLNEKHFNRGDISDFLIRSTLSRVKFADRDFPSHDTNKIIKKGDIVIGNLDFGQYKGELQLVKKEHPNTSNRKNVVAQIVDHEIFLLDYIKPWQNFRFTEFKK